jgi:hypothetical protein
MTHSFLFEPAVWTSTGTLWRADGEPLETIGRTEIAHCPECWLQSGTLKVLGSPPTEFVHGYMIERPVKDGATMKWTFESAMFGTLLGRYAVIAPSIVSEYGCETAGARGAEHLGRVDASHYRAAGMLLLKDAVIYTWQSNLQRQR